jgi:hypothetical protein
MKEFESNKPSGKQGSFLPALKPQTSGAPFFQSSSVQQNTAVQTKPIGGPALAATPAAQSSTLPADVVKKWKAHIAANNLLQAIQVVADEMAKRGEIDRSIYQVQPTVAGSDTCKAPNTQLFILDSNVQGANTSQCDCVKAATGTTELANPRIHIHPDLVQFTKIGSTNPQTDAIVLHSTLLHEFRHIRQQYEECNTPGIVKSSGTCTDCNDPGEMDAYLAQIEAGYDKWQIHDAWIRVYVNWDYLSASQQAIFKTRRKAAELKVDKLFPKVPWHANGKVLTYQAWCKNLPGNGSPGGCNSSLTGSSPSKNEIK